MNKSKLPAELRSITPELARRLFDACDRYSICEKKNSRWKLYLMILWQTGLRASEALAITTSDIETDRIRVIRLKRRKPVLDYVPIQKQLYSKIKDYIDKYKVRGRLFPVSYDGAVYAFNKIKKLAGVGQDYTLHSFRHGFAYHYLERYKDEGDVLTRLQRALGHVSLSSTGEYTKVRYDRIKRDIEGIEF